MWFPKKHLKNAIYNINNSVIYFKELELNKKNLFLMHSSHNNECIKNIPHFIRKIIYYCKAKIIMFNINLKKYIIQKDDIFINIYYNYDKNKDLYINFDISYNNDF